MKILIYLGHPAHFYIFKNAIPAWKRSGHQVFILIKKKDVLEDLLKAANLPYYNILEEGRGDSKIGIFWGVLKRTIRLYRFCVKNKPTILIGTSVENSFIGKILCLPVINLNEDDAAVVPQYAKLSYPFASEILNPIVCNSGKWDSKAIKYNSYHELAYLHPNHFTADRKVVDKYFNSSEPYFLVRLSSLTAYHDYGIKGLNDQIVQKIIDILIPFGKVCINSERLLDEQFEPYRISINPLDMHHIMAFAQIYIGDSQTMAAESGVLGVPFIRFNDFVGKIGYLNELENFYKLGFGIKTDEIERLYSTLDILVKMPDRFELFKERRNQMLSDKIDFASFLIWFIENYPVSAQILKENPDYQYRFKGTQNEIQNESEKIHSVPTQTEKISEKNLSTYKKLSRFAAKSDFTLSTYRNLLITIQQAGYAFYTFEDWCLGKAQGKYVILRHDVDLKAFHSLATAKIEAEMGIRSSYYFRVVPQSNQPTIISAIAALNHEIGYHYEDMSIFKGDIEKSIRHFEKQLAYFRQFYPVQTITMHGSPTSKWDNRDLWKSYNYRDYGIIGEPYLDLLTPDSLTKGTIAYFTDTARMWNGDKYNVRDKRILEVKDAKVNKKLKGLNIHSSFDFINWLKTEPPVNVLMITTHPQRWTDNLAEWFMEWTLQRMKNTVKQLFYVQK